MELLSQVVIDLVTWGWSCWEIPPTNLFAQVAEVRQSALIDHLVLEVDNFATGCSVTIYL